MPYSQFWDIILKMPLLHSFKHDVRWSQSLRKWYPPQCEWYPLELCDPQVLKMMLIGLLAPTSGRVYSNMDVFIWANLIIRTKGVLTDCIVRLPSSTLWFYRRISKAEIIEMAFSRPHTWWQNLDQKPVFLNSTDRHQQRTCCCSPCVGPWGQLPSGKQSFMNGTQVFSVFTWLSKGGEQDEEFIRKASVPTGTGEHHLG